MKCPTKCWLRAAGEVSIGNSYAEWVKTQDESYREKGTTRLVDERSNGELATSPDAENLKSAKWQLATNVVVQAKVGSCPVETNIAVVERVPSEGRGKAAQFVPTRFVFTNKLGKDERRLLAFDAFVLSGALGREISVGKIIHGENHATLKVKTSALAGEVRKRLEKIAALLASATPPDLALNRHCAECEFRDRCRQKAIETDDLSLLAGMSAKERDTHRSKGIFTVTQLSYTFRPRRTPKRAKNPAKPRYLALQALAIRENIHVDETTVHLSKGKNGYVWVLTSMDKVYYFYRPSREGAFLEELVSSFSGVLVSDFYTAYDSLPCAQQKCLAHLVRDIDDDLLKNPLDIEFKGIATDFGVLLKAIVQTIDRYGLKKRHLHKHKREVLRFLNSVASRTLLSELAVKYQKRFQKSGSKMFTFLDHEGVPWNNNNAEHAIKRFAKYRRDANGKFTEASLREYLVMASVLETCEFNNVSVLDFLLSKETTLSGLFRMAGREIEPSSQPTGMPAMESRSTSAATEFSQTSPPAPRL